jgi:hypothetical protein
MTLKHRDEDYILKREAYIYSRYLLGSNPSEELAERYIRANRALGTDHILPVDTRVLEFARSHQWSIPLLDAGAGLLQPEALLRKKIYIMAAILETSPDHAREFLPQVLSPILLALKLIANGISAGVKIFIGIPLLILVRGRDHG